MPPPRNQGKIGADELRRLVRPPPYSRTVIVPDPPAPNVVTAEDIRRLSGAQSAPVTPPTTRLPRSLGFFDQHVAAIEEMNRTAFYTKPTEIVTRIRSSLDAGWTCTLSRDLFEDCRLAIYFTNMTTKKVTWTDPRGNPSTSPPPYESTLGLDYCYLGHDAGPSDVRFACTHDGHLFFGYPLLGTTHWGNPASLWKKPVFRKQPTAYTIEALEACGGIANMKRPTYDDLMKMEALGIWPLGSWKRAEVTAWLVNLESEGLL